MVKNKKNLIKNYNNLMKKKKKLIKNKNNLVKNKKQVSVLFVFVNTISFYSLVLLLFQCIVNLNFYIYLHFFYSFFRNLYKLNQY